MKAIKVKVLEYLLENGRDNVLNISKGIGSNYSNVYQNVTAMEELYIERYGNSKYVSLKRKLTPLLYQAESNRKDFLLKAEDIRNINRKLDKIQNPFFIVLLFGSRLEGKKNRDIDLCVITDSAEVKKQVEEELDTLTYDVDLNVFTSKQFREMIALKKPNLGNEILSRNVVLKGIENYYELIKWEK